jgi:hypothetical protein
MSAPKLRVVQKTDDVLRMFIRDRDKALREIEEIDDAMFAYRKRYAAEHGEYMLPTIERLRRELLG